MKRTTTSTRKSSGIAVASIDHICRDSPAQMVKHFSSIFVTALSFRMA
jgi:hypothetical protein